MEGFDSPRPRGSFVNDTVEMAVRYYAMPGNCVGGALHVVLDDNNLHWSHIAWCRDEIENHWATEGRDLCREIADRMLRMSKTQRRVMVARLGCRLVEAAQLERLEHWAEGDRHNEGVLPMSRSASAGS